ncbi:hypothetical protein D3C85_1695660 [compost metagenome]
MNEYILYFYDKRGIIDNFKFKTYDDFSAIKKTERILSIICYKQCSLHNKEKLIKRFNNKETKNDKSYNR